MYRAWRTIASCLLVALVLGTSTAGCITTHSWERGILAKPSMSPDPDGDREALRGHFLGLREGAQGGFGAGGGGCGCN